MMPAEAEKTFRQFRDTPPTRRQPGRLMCPSAKMHRTKIHIQLLQRLEGEGLVKLFLIGKKQKKII